MRRLPVLFVAVVVGLLLSAAPNAQAAAPKSAKGTIAAPALTGSSLLAAGNLEGEATVTQVRQACPTGGVFDGVFYRFFDLKGGYTKFKASGPKPLVTETVPDNPATNPITYNEYDIDIFAFDAKCNRIEAPNGSKATGTSTGGIENLTIRKPARYAAVSYYNGPYPNIEVTLEYSN